MSSFHNSRHTVVVARNDIPTCSQPSPFRPFFLNPPKLRNVYIRQNRLDRTDDLDVFELFSQHLRERSAERPSSHTSLMRSVASDNLLQLCRIEPMLNRTDREEENENVTETQL